MAKVSVLMCVYNGEKYLSDSIESILNQSYPDFELVLVNDGSTDGSTVIIAYYAKKDKRIIPVINPENYGIAASVSTGLKYCSGEYIARMDQDDKCLPDRLLMEFQFLEANPEIDVVGTGLIFIDENGDPLGKQQVPPTDPMVIRLHMYYHCVIYNPTVLMRSSYYQQYNENANEKEFFSADDYAFWLRKNHTHLYTNLSEPYLLYRMHGKQTSVQKKQGQMEETLRSVQFAYERLLGYTIPTQVIESFYYIQNVTINSLSIIKKGMETVLLIQKAFEKQNHLSKEQKYLTRKFSYEKLKSIIAKYKYLPGVLLPGILLLARISPQLLIKDIMDKCSRLVTKIISI